MQSLNVKLNWVLPNDAYCEKIQPYSYKCSDISNLYNEEAPKEM